MIDSQRVSQRIQQMQESSTLQMARLSRQLQSEGKKIINLSLGEPDFDTPNHIKDAAIRAIENNITHYPPVAGFLELRQALSEKFKRDNNLEYSPNQILVSTGAKHSLINVLMTLLDEGDEVIIPAPYWVSYPEMVKLTGASSIIVETSLEADFKMTAKQLRAAITENTKAIILNSPSNPTGAVYTLSELEALAEVLRNEDIIVISDEIYELINYGIGHYSIATLTGMYDKTVTINGVSKAFAMTGWRIGYAAGPEWLIKACEKLQGQFTSGANTIAEMATIAAVSESYQPTYDMLAEFVKRKELVLAGINDIGKLGVSIPEGAFYLFPDVSAYLGTKYKEYEVNTSDDLCMYLLAEAEVSLVSGTGFGAANCIRISFAASEQNLTLALARIKTALHNLV
ncbi:MAG: pyridoxal phosphate-dependent aminotransferase [Bacteroidota bacterium]|nr:pyridoxal phosphate-dependent aminotransferase [Bacteroidota bacterium]